MRAFVLAIICLCASFGAKGQDIAAGEKTFQLCATCHAVGEGATNRVGPKLNGLNGSKAAAVLAFPYSDALRASGVVWDDKTFAEFMANPRATAPGTKMAFAGLKDERQIADLWAFLKQFDATGKFTKAQAPADADAAPDPATLACLQNLGAAAGPKACAAVGGELLQAVGALLTGYPASGYGMFEGGALVDRRLADRALQFRRLSLFPADPCVAEESVSAQDKSGQWSLTERNVYDFRKVTRVRYLLSIQDIPTVLSASADNPAVKMISLEGEDWICHANDLSAAPRPGNGSTCENSGMPANGYGENQATTLGAIAAVREACGLPK